MSYSRFAIYYAPPEGALAQFGAGWLGWDVNRGCAARQPDLPGLSDITAAPRKYGFHGTLKPPFRLADGFPRAALEEAVSDVAATLAPATCSGLDLTVMGRFLALTPRGEPDALQRVAASCVRALDRFRAAPDDAELARRRSGGLSPRQEALLAQWGYPYVMEQFRFHMTLTGRLPKADLPAWTETVQRHLPPLPAPFVLDQIALCGARYDDGFEVIRRYALGDGLS